MSVNEVLAPRYNLLLHRLLGMEEGAPSPSLAPELFAMFVLEADRPEWGHLAQVPRFWGYAQQAAVAGQFAHVQFFNPANSGVVATLESAVVETGAAGLWQFGRRDTAITTAAYTVIPCDGRRELPGGANLPCVLQPRQQSNATSLITVIGFQSNSLAATPQPYYGLDLVITPGRGIVFQGLAANNRLTVSAHWRERTMEASELT